MARGNPNWGQDEPVPWTFCIRGKNPNGKIVALGSYRTKEEATAHHGLLTKEGYYKDLQLLPFSVQPGPKTEWKQWSPRPDEAV